MLTRRVSSFARELSAFTHCLRNTATQLQFTTHIHSGFIDKDICKMHCYKQPDYSAHINHRSRVLFT